MDVLHIVFWSIFLISVPAVMVLAILKMAKNVNFQPLESKKNDGLDWPITDRFTGVPIHFDDED